MERHYGVEQAIHCASARLEVDAQEAREEKVRLPRFDGNCGRNAACIEIPTFAMNRVLRNDAPGAKQTGLSVDFQDTIN
jgi:hypothetical protein